MSKPNLPGFTADGSLYKTTGHYRSHGRAMNLPIHPLSGIFPTAETIQVRSCPPGYDQVGTAGEGEPLVCIQQQQGGGGGGGGGGGNGGPGSGGGGGGGKGGGGKTGGKNRANGRDGGDYNPVEGAPCCGGPDFQRGTYRFDQETYKEWMCCQSINGRGCVGCGREMGRSKFCKDGSCFLVASVTNSGGAVGVKV